MNSSYLIVASAVVFSVIGLLAAFGIAAFAPTPSPMDPHFERTTFVLLPIGGAAVG